MSTAFNAGDTPPVTPPPATPPAAPPATLPGAPPETPPATPPVTPPADLLSLFSEDARKSAAFNGVTDIKTLEQRILTLQGTVDGQGVKVPGENATPEEVAAYRKAIGVPEKAEDYQFKAPDGMQNPEATLQWFSGVAHKHGIPASAAQAVLNDYYEMTKQGQEAFDAELASKGEAVIKGWQQQFGQAFNQKMDNMRLALEQVAGSELWPEVKAMMEAPQTGNNPTVLKLTMKLGEFISEMRGEPSLRTDAQHTTLAITPTEAQAKINAIIGDKNSPYWDAKHPQYAAVVAETEKLFRSLVPPGQPEKVGA